MMHIFGSADFHVAGERFELSRYSDGSMAVYCRDELVIEGAQHCTSLAQMRADCIRWMALRIPACYWPEVR